MLIIYLLMKLKRNYVKILTDNKELINITPDEIELDKLELEPKSNLDSDSTTQ